MQLFICDKCPVLVTLNQESKVDRENNTGRALYFIYPLHTYEFDRKDYRWR